MVLALQVIQTPAGPRIVQGDEAGRQAPSLWTPFTNVYEATEGAGNALQDALYGHYSVFYLVEVLALTGSPTNIMYSLGVSLDGGTTWYNAPSATATATGLVAVAGGPNAGAIATGNDVKASISWGLALPGLTRLNYAFTGGTNPTVHHRVWRAYA